MRLKNKIAIVTGGSQGIGEAICYAYAQEGAVVIVVNKNKPELGKKVASTIERNGGLARAIACDIANYTEVRNLIDYVFQEYGTIDILVNNAGILIAKPIEDYSLADWDMTFDINVKGAFLMSQATVPIMKRNHYGKIICITSVVSSVGFANASVYCASKGALLMLVKSLAAELANYGINVNALSPGNVATPMNAEWRTDKDLVQRLENRTPSGKAYLTTQDIVGAAVFLASDDASAIHGLDLIVDGGWCAI